MKNKEIKFETLRKSHKKYIIAGVVAVCIIGSILTFRLTHSKYGVTQSIDLGSGVINYKQYDFKIMAMYKSDDKTNYSEITTMPTSGYIINEDKTYCTVDNVNHDTEAKVYTYEGKHVFENLKKSDKCYLYFDKDTGILATSVSDLITKLKSIAKTTSPNFSKAATTDEGIFQTSDGTYGGTTYYWRGKVENNHVIFANKCWRIIRINGDKTIRLIYNGTPSGTASNQTCLGNESNTSSIAVTYQAYNSSSNQSNYVGWTYSGTSQRGTSNASNAKMQIEEWYSNTTKGNLKAYESKIADGKFCNDREIASGYTWSISGSSFKYAAYDRLETSSPSPTFNCTNSEDVYTLKIGLITLDEVIFAGALYSTVNKSYYLYNGQNYWTMSPRDWFHVANNSAAETFYVNSNGTFSNAGVYNTIPSLRPVINLKSDVTFSSGDGTQNQPYVVS